MKLKRFVNSRDEEVVKLIALYQEVFPESERFRDDQILLNLIDNNQSLHFKAIYEDDELAGLFMYWTLEKLHYIHFLAVYPEMRNRKIGKKVLDWIAENFKQPVFLEADDPEDEISTRRIHFYERNGYQVLAKNPEILYEARERSCKLWLMGNTPVEYLDDYIRTIRDVIYKASGE